MKTRKRTNTQRSVETRYETTLTRNTLRDKLVNKPLMLPTHEIKEDNNF